MTEPEEEQTRRDWRAAVLRLFVSALVVAAVALAAAWALNSAHNQKTAQKPTGKSVTQGTKKPKTSKTETAKKKNQTTGKPQQTAGSSSGAGAGAASSGAPAAAPAQPTGNLTNTGPGDVAGLVIITSLSASGLYYLVVLRRLNAQ